MKVTLLSKTDNFLNLIFTAARTCYSADTPSNIFSNVADGGEDREQMLKLIRGIINSGNHSVIEHATFTFAVDGVSRALLAQFTRHRIGMSYSVQNQRYVNFFSVDGSVFDHVVPKSIKDDCAASTEFMGMLYELQKAYDKLIDYGIKKEDARFLLPNAACTNIVTTMNLRSFINLYKLCSAKRAQWEIKNMVVKMRNILVANEPWLAEFLPFPE